MSLAWTGKYKTKGKADQADCLIAFSFGYRGKRKKIQPGLSNQDLANIALKNYAKLPKIMQFEVADAYNESEGEGAGKILRITKHSKRGMYLDTREVAVQTKKLMDEHGWKKALILAHPYHMPRVQLVCTRAGIDWVAEPDERGAVEFDPLSTQKWTRNLDNWRGYEPLALMFYRLKGWA